MSFKFVALAVAVEFVLGFLLAFVFSAKIRGLGILRRLGILPMMVMPVATGLVWFYIFNQNYGMANFFVGLLGLDPQPWLTDTGLGPHRRRRRGRLAMDPVRHARHLRRAPVAPGVRLRGRAHGRSLAVADLLARHRAPAATGRGSSSS